MQDGDLEQVVAIERLVQSHAWSAIQFQDALASYQCTVYAQAHQVLGFCILQPVLDEAILLLMAMVVLVSYRNLILNLQQRFLQKVYQHHLHRCMDCKLPMDH